MNSFLGHFPPNFLTSLKSAIANANYHLDSLDLILTLWAASHGGALHKAVLQVAHHVFPAVTNALLLGSVVPGDVATVVNVIDKETEADLLLSGHDFKYKDFF